MDLSTRERLEKSEQDIRKARLEREHEQREGDRAQRERLERQSPSGSRLSLVDILNGHSRERAASEGGLDVITKLRADQELGRRTASQHNRSYERFEKSADFNRLMPVNSGGSYGEARLVETRAVKPRGQFDFDAGRDPGRRQDSQFQWSDKFDPPGRVGRVRDAAGSMDADARTRADHWSGQGLHGIDPAFLLDVARRLIEIVNSPRYARGRV
jgi:hypothetical protein